MQEKINRPSILCIGGLDPSGGAGLQADIEAIAANGGHALPIATSLTVQNSQNVYAVEPVRTDLVSAQFESLLADCPIHACKIGLIPSIECVDLLVHIASHLENIPIVLDPVLRASGGMSLNGAELIPTLKEKLLPLITVLTPNLSELHSLSNSDSDDTKQALELCDVGASYVLVTTCKEDQENGLLTHTLFSEANSPIHFHCEKLAHEYHGSGCTLSSALTTQLALGNPIETAVETAINYTVNTLRGAERLGKGQHIPRRIF